MVRGGGLRRIDDEAVVLFGERVHARAGGEVVGRLRAAVQHDDQRERLPTIAAGDVELVNAASGLVPVGPRHELGAVGHDVARWRCRLRHLAQCRDGAGPVYPRERAAKRLGHLPAGRLLRLVGGAAADVGLGRLLGTRGRLGVCDLDCFGHYVNDRRSESGRRVGDVLKAVGGAIGRRCTSEQSLQERGRVGEPAGESEAGRLKHVRMHSVAHVQSFLCWETGQASSRGRPHPSPDWECRRRELMASGEAVTECGRRGRL
jgi:hypothetical protein